MKTHYLLLLLFTLSACSKKEADDTPFDVFVYSFSDSPNNFSIKFTPGDTVYMQKRDGAAKKNFYALMAEADRDTLATLTNAIQFPEVESTAMPRMNGGIIVTFFRIADGKEQLVCAVSKSDPQNLLPHALKFTEFARRFNFAPTDTKVDFGNLKYTIPQRQTPIPDTEN